MENKSKTMTRVRLLEHFSKYPKAEIKDLFKFLYQSAYGCEHLVTDTDRVCEYIKSEYADYTPKGRTWEALDGDYIRLYLDVIGEGLNPTTLAKLFILSAKSETDAMEHLVEKLQVAREMIIAGELPFGIEKFDEEREAWRIKGYPAVHHSDNFRSAYGPGYRVIKREYAPFIPLITEIDRLLLKGDAVIAIEGGSAGGKTTLSSLLEKLYGCNVIHADDFFLRPHQRTEKRLMEIGGNFDRERFAEEILPQLKAKKSITYRRFDCSTRELTEPITLAANPLTVVEGVYSTHLSFGKYYDLSVFLDISEEEQRARIEKRNSGALAQRFFEEWIPMEKVYFDKTEIIKRTDIVIKIP